MGIDASLLFQEDLPQAPTPRLNQLTSPFRIAAALLKRAHSADVVDVAGLDAWVYARFARARRSHQAVVCRSNGLWYRALATGGESHPSSRTRRLLSDLYQDQILCRWERSSIKSADIAIFLSHPDAEEVVRQGWKSPDTVAVVNPGVDEFFASAVPLDVRTDVAFVGTFFHRKGSDVVASSMSRILKERTKLGLTLFGTGLPRSAVLAHFDEGVRERVTVIESVPSTELARQLECFAVMVFPTRYEGFGIVVLEAMRAGLAVVTTPTGAGVDVVRNGENGLIVPIGDVEATIAAVSRLLDDAVFRMKLAATATEDASHCSWRRAAEDLVLVYESGLALAARRSSGRA